MKTHLMMSHPSYLHFCLAEKRAQLKTIPTKELCVCTHTFWACLFCANIFKILPTICPIIIVSCWNTMKLARAWIAFKCSNFSLVIRNSIARKQKQQTTTMTHSTAQAVSRRMKLERMENKQRDGERGRKKWTKRILFTQSFSKNS